jgi:hypothetical protein
VTRLGRYGLGYDLYVWHLAWEVLLLDGRFPTRTPPTLRAALRAPQMTPAQLVEQARSATATSRRCSPTT